MTREEMTQEFELLYQRHFTEIWALVFALCWDADAAMDSAQDAFLKLWKQWAKGEVIPNPPAWLRVVAVNRSKDKRRSKFHRHGTVAPEAMQDVQSYGLSPDQLAGEKDERTSLRAAIREALAALSADDRRLLLLATRGYSYSQLGELRGVTWQSVKARLSRIKTPLRARLKRFAPPRYKARRSRPPL